MKETVLPFDNRVTRMLGIEIPIVQAPMGWIARAPLASAVSNAGALGIIETSSGELDTIREEIARMRDLTDRPFGVNIAQASVTALRSTRTPSERRTAASIRRRQLLRQLRSRQVRRVV